jgi:hypothetical protein
VPEFTEHELETAKLYQDAFKHLATFCSGGILLSSSVVAALFEDPRFLWLLFVSLALLGGGAFLATFGLITNLNHLDFNFRASAREADAEFMIRKLKRKRSNEFWSSASTAFGGVVTFALFALWNFVS